MTRRDERTHFGYESVPLEDKQGRVDDVFHSVAAALRPDERPDVGRAAPRLEGCAGDSGQPTEERAAVRAARSRGRHRRRRFPRRRRRRRRHRESPFATSTPTCSTSAVNAPCSAGSTALLPSKRAMPRQLPYSDRSFDCVTIAFGIRNVPRIERALAEAFRVLQDRRPISLPGIFFGRRAGSRRALRTLFLPA